MSIGKAKISLRKFFFDFTFLYAQFFLLTGKTFTFSVCKQIFLKQKLIRILRYPYLEAATGGLV